jgi:hypothetical protein
MTAHVVAWALLLAYIALGARWVLATRPAREDRTYRNRAEDWTPQDPSRHLTGEALREYWIVRGIEQGAGL